MRAETRQSAYREHNHGRTAGSAQHRALRVDRRRVLVGGAVASTSWIAPTVLTFDRVAAAVGSCGTAPVRLDWSAHANTFPSNVVANDGTSIAITTSDPFGVADPSFLGLVFGGTTSQRDNPIVLAMENANNGEYVRIQFDFSRPVQLCFELLDVDRAQNGWEDTIEMTGTNAGAAVSLNAADVTTGGANTFAGVNTVRGTSSAPNSQTTGNVTVTFPAAIDRLVIEHRDDSTFTQFQYIGVHDFRWC